MTDEIFTIQDNMYILPNNTYHDHRGKCERMVKKTVKVRGRDGTATMDISIPAQITREFDIERGEVFAVETADDEDGRLVLTYTRVYEGEETPSNRN